MIGVYMGIHTCSQLEQIIQRDYTYRQTFYRHSICLVGALQIYDGIGYHLWPRKIGQEAIQK